MGEVTGEEPRVAIALEVLDRRGRVAQRVRLDQLPVRIGRGLANDVPIDDPYVCPAHAQVVRDPDGRLVAEDLGSVNGLWAHDPPRRVARVALDTTDTLRVGRTVLRVRSSAAPLAPTLLDRAGPEPPPAPLPLRLGVCGAALAAVGVDAWLGSYGPHALRDAAAETVVVLVIALAWSTSWAFVNRVLGHQWNLLGHLAVVCGFVFGMLALGILAAYAGFLVSNPRLVDPVEMVLAALLIAVLLDGHLRLCAPTPSGRRRLAAIGAAAIFVGLVEFLPRLANDGFSDELRFGSALRPVPAAWLPARSLDQFVAGLDQVQRDVDALAGEPP